MLEVLSSRERILLEGDAASRSAATKLARIAVEVDAEYIKFGPVLPHAIGWDQCSYLAASHGLGWVADAKLHHTPDDMKRIVNHIRDLEYPPFAITVHAASGVEAMRAAQKEAGAIMVLGVTALSLAEKDDEALNVYRVSRHERVLGLARCIADAGLRGLTVYPKELRMVKDDPLTADLIAMVYGTHSAGPGVRWQATSGTPAEAVWERAGLVVVDDQIMGAKDPTTAFEALMAEIDGVKSVRGEGARKVAT